jgi:ABC-type antimicrobial peptide transport system permease subunit
VFPTYGDAGQLGDGALMTFQGLQRVLADAKTNVFLIRFRPGVDRGAQLTKLRRELEPVPTRSSGRPRDLEDLADVQSLPAILAIIVALLAAATLAHTLISSVRRRQRELAVLKTLGFRRRQIGLTVVWQTTTLVVIALVIGLPLGLLFGRFAWNLYAENLGAVADSAVPVAAALVAIPVTIVFANLVAAVPAWFAGRIRPAAALRAE